RSGRVGSRPSLIFRRLLALAAACSLRARASVPPGRNSPCLVRNSAWWTKIWSMGSFSGTCCVSMLMRFASFGFRAAGGQQGVTALQPEGLAVAVAFDNRPLDGAAVLWQVILNGLIDPRNGGR